MKKRNSFVSNSSASSFIVIGEPFDFVECAELTEEQKASILSNKGKPYDERKAYLTPYISDGSSMYSSLSALEDCHVLTCPVYSYDEGNHGGPYQEDRYDELDDDIWILKEDNKGENIEILYQVG